MLKSISLIAIYAEVVKWQTRWTQNPVWATMCGFKSRLRHHNKKVGLSHFFYCKACWTWTVRRKIVQWTVLQDSAWKRSGASPAFGTNRKSNRKVWFFYKKYHITNSSLSAYPIRNQYLQNINLFIWINQLNNI